jgi:hypothetical protein
MKLVYKPPLLYYAKAAKGSIRPFEVNQGLQKKALPVLEMAIFAKFNFRAVNF